MPTLPSIKGSVFCAAVEDVQKLVAAKKLKPDELTRWLKPKDFGYLQAPVQPFEYTKTTSFMRESDRKARAAAFGRDLRRLVALQANILNFGRNES